MTQQQWPAGQVAFVTGAASGIGLGISRALAAAGAKVALADIDTQRLSKVETELTQAGGVVLTVSLDIRDSSQWEKTIDHVESKLGPISILCNNAGVNGSGMLDEVSLDVWRWIFQINTEAQFIGISTILPRMKQRGNRAHIINTASMAGLVPMARAVSYCSSKFASIGLTMALREELEGTNVDISLLCPGTVATRINTTAALEEAKLLNKKVNLNSIEANGILLKQGADPDSVGIQVVEAIQKRQFLIVTHKEWEPLIKKVHAEITQTFNNFDGRHGSDPTPELLQSGNNPIP